MAVDERTRSAVRRLTENEKECLRRRLIPQTAKEMALDLGISPHAVEKRLKMARAKLGLSSSLEAARLLASEEGEYQPTVPQAADLPGPEQPDQDALVAPRRRDRRPLVLATGAFVVMIFASLLLAIAPQSAPQPPSPTPVAAPSTAQTPPGPPGTEPIESVVFRPASPDEIRAFVKDAFRTMDKDGSGFIERAEAPN